MNGKAYLGYSRSKQNCVFHDVDRFEKNIQPSCNSEVRKKSLKRNCNKITEEDRLKIFNYFWGNLNWDKKKMYVNSLVSIAPVKQRTVESSQSRRISSFIYNLRIDDTYLCVCKTMFLNTLGLGEKQVHSWCLTRKDEINNCDNNIIIEKKRSTLKITPDKRKRIFASKFLKIYQNFPHTLFIVENLPLDYILNHTYNLYLNCIICMLQFVMKKIKNMCQEKYLLMFIMK